MGRLSLIALVVLSACGRQGGDPPPLAALPACEPAPPPDITLRRMGFQEDGTFVGPGGRHIMPAGPSTIVEGMAGDLELHPNGQWAYVTSTSRYDRLLYVIDVATGAILQELEREEAFHGMDLSSDGSLLAASAGADARVDLYAVGSDGLLTEAGALSLEGWVGDVVFRDDDAVLWVGWFDEGRIDEVEVATGAVLRTFDTSTGAWELVVVPETEELYYGELGGTEVGVVDLASGTEVASIAALSPASLAVAGDRVLVAEADGDRISAIDTATHAIDATIRLGEDFYAADGQPLPHSNVNGLFVDLDGDRVFATRGVDNAVSVLRASTLEPLGAIPTAYYPTAVQLASDGRTLVVTELKGGGVGPGDGEGAKELQKGSVTTIDLATLDLELATLDAIQSFRSALDNHPYPCPAASTFPIPAGYGGGSPIEHVILVVKENKTFDCLFGDLGDTLDVAANPEHLRWPAELTPNQRALAAEFNIADNFYTESQDSDSGHLFLTTGHWTEFTERLWWEFDRNGSIGWQVTPPVTPSTGNFFNHVLDSGPSLQVYGEIVGMFSPSASGALPIDHSDPDYPGGPAYNTAAKDEDKVRYVLEQVAAHGLADFTFLAIPNDHTAGTNPGTPTPESMVADNDYAVGLLVEGISADPDLWAKTAIFILEDDPQGCSDHIDATRSFLIVASPWAKRGHVSHVNMSYVSVFATIERLLGIPPVGRPTAAAAPVWDLFQGEPDLTPFTARPRIPEDTNRRSAFGAAFSQSIDLDGPDRDPRLSGLLDAYRLWRMGRITREEAEARLALAHVGIEEERWEWLEEEAEEEIFAFDVAWAQYERWAEAKGLPRPRRPAEHWPADP